MDGDRAGDAFLLVSSGAGGGARAVILGENSQDMIYATLAKMQTLQKKA